MDFFAIWEHVLSYVKEHDPQYFTMFSTQIFPVSFEGNTFTLKVQKAYLSGWLNAIYGQTLKDIIREQTGTEPVLAFEFPVAPASSAPAAVNAAPKAAAAPFPDPSPAPAVVREEAAPFPAEPPFPEDAPLPERPLPIDVSAIKPRSADQVELPNIHEILQEQSGDPQTVLPGMTSTPPPAPKRVTEDKRNTFENFIYGNCNRMAYQAAKSVAEAASRMDYSSSLNPLFIYGPSGLGKTHLLHAIRNYVNDHAKTTRAVFLTSEAFTNELISAIKSQTQEKFRRKYRTVDVLLLDDVQFFGGRDSSAQELFSTFNMLFESRKHIIMASDRTPDDIKNLEDRLQSRFASGFVVQISPPDFEICCAILSKRAEQDGIHMPDDVIDFISSHINKNVRILEGAYNSVKVHCSMNHIPITLENAKEALKNSAYIKKTTELTVDRIIDTVCNYYSVNKGKLLGPSRPKKIAFPRQVAMYLCRSELGESYPALAEVFNKKDHTSVLYACEKIQDTLDTDPAFKKTMEHIQDLLRK